MTAEQWDTLKNIEEDGLIELSDEQVLITVTGKPYIRTICAVFDPTVDITINQKGLFSTSI